MKTKKKVTGLICVCVALAVFTASAIAAASNVSGYQRLKDLAFRTVGELDNATVEVTRSVTQNGEVLSYHKALTMMGGDKNYFLSWSEEDGKQESYSDGERYIWVMDENYYYDRAYDEYELLDFALNGKHYNGYANSLEATLGLGRFSPAQKRFAEILTDTLVGGSKNNVVYSGGKVSLRLSDSQISELAQFALAVFAEDLSKHKNSLHHIGGAQVYLGADARITEAWLEADLGPDGISADVTAKLSVVSTVDGVPYAVDCYFGVKLSDVGTTAVPKPDVTGKRNAATWSVMAEMQGCFHNKAIGSDENGDIYGRCPDGSLIYEPFYGILRDGQVSIIYNEDGFPLAMWDKDGNRVDSFDEYGFPIYDAPN